MKICLLYSKNDFPIYEKHRFLKGIFIERNVFPRQADILVISEKDATAEAFPAICNSAKRMGSREIFIDSPFSCNELISSLSDAGFDVFSPYSKKLPHSTIPVIETSVSGGSLSEFLESARSTLPRFAVSVNKTAYEIALPADKNSAKELSQKALRLLISSHDPDIFFSPQLMCKYFIINAARDSVSLILFDDAETVSGKLRLAKKHGASHAFLVYREIADIFDEISF